MGYYVETSVLPQGNKRWLPYKRYRKSPYKTYEEALQANTEISPQDPFNTQCQEIYADRSQAPGCQ